MATSRQGKTLDKRETESLIGSDKVEGTPVYRSNGERAGQIERIMIDKLSGKVAYAVMSFGGFMGIGEDYYPLPWSLLTYNPKLEGYEVNVSEQQLKGALVRSLARPEHLRLLWCRSLLGIIKANYRSGARGSRWPSKYSQVQNRASGKTDALGVRSFVGIGSHVQAG